MIRRSTWVLLGVFALVFAVFLLTQRARPESTADEAAATPLATERPLLFDLPAGAAVLGLKLADQQGNQVELRRENASADWVMPGFEADTVDAEAVNNAISQLLAVRLLATLAEPPDPTAMGLDAPQFTITLETSVGATRVLEVGKTTINSSSLYARDGAQVVVLSKFSIEAVTKFLADKPLVATASPEATASP